MKQAVKKPYSKPEIVQIPPVTMEYEQVMAVLNVNSSTEGKNRKQK